MLQNEAMIVRLSVSQWTARKFDKKVTRKVNEDYGAREDAGRYNKVLVAKEAIQSITKTVSAIRAFHYDNTLPWDDSGARLLPSANFMTYSAEMRKLGDAFNKAVEEFSANYREYRDEAKSRLNGMFNANDYPSVYEIEAKYKYGIDIEPVPTSADFRVSLQDRDAKRIKADIDKRVKVKEAEAMKDLFLRLHKVVAHYAEKLGDPEAIFRDSLIDNLVDLVGLLPKLNVSNDQNLVKLAKSAKDKLVGYSPAQLRSDPEVRKSAASAADEVLKKMAGYTG